MITNNMIQLKSYDKNTGNEIGNVFPITSSEAVKVENDKNLKDKLIELNEQIKQTNSLLDNINNTVKKEYFPTFKGTNLYIMNNTTTSTITTYLDDIKNTGCNAVLIIVHNKYANGTFVPNLTDEQVIYSIIEAKKRNIKPILKLHRMGVYETNDISSWITEWGTIVYKYVEISKTYDIDTIVFCNEQDKFTKTNREEWKIIIDRIKANGLKVAISYRGVAEYYSSVLNDLVDIIGINHYPKMTTNGYDISDTQMLRKFYSFYNVVNNARYKYNKEVWITEIGCTRNIDALSDPSNWMFKTEEQSFIPQILYYKNLLKAYAESEQLKLNGIFFWSTDKKDKINSFSPFGNEECEKIISSYEVYNNE